MRLIFAADIHARKTPPIHRVDDFWEAAQRKFSWLIDLCIERGAPLVLAGDIYDSPLVGIEVVNFIDNELERLRWKLGTPAYFVAGQHDLTDHVLSLRTSPLNVLVNAGHVLLCPWYATEIVNPRDPEESVSALGCSWEQERVPGVKSDILVMHRPVTNGPPPFFMEEAVDGNRLLEKLEKDHRFIVCGDYHDPFTIDRPHNKLINCGPMIRQKINEASLTPTAWEIETTSFYCQPHLFPAEQNVFATDRIDELKAIDPELGKELKSLSEALKLHPELLRNFKGICRNLNVKDNKYLTEVLEHVD